MNDTCSPHCTQGWTSSSSSRGSIDIIWACLSVLILCSWSCVCCNVRAPTDSSVRHLMRKLWLTLIGIIGPEFLLYISMTQMLSARRSVREFRKLGYQQWTIKHAFLADMGGFRLKTPDTESFPINSRSLIFLVQNGFIPKQQIKSLVLIDSDTIEDRNKTDSCARLIALAQSCWFSCNVAARYAQGLSITTLELTVIGFLVPTAATYVCWWHKPRDVMTTQIIVIDTSLPSILDFAGVESYSEWHISPFDIIERSEFHGSVLFRYWVNILKRLMHLHQPFNTRFVKVCQRRSDNDIHGFDNHWRYGWIEVLPTIPYLAVNFTAWNTHFPSSIELWMWRISSVVMAACLLIGLITELICLTFWPADQEKQTLQRHRAKAYRTSHNNHYSMWSLCMHSIERFLQRCRNNSASDDPNLDVVLRMLLPATILAALYCLSRLYILGEDIAAFRSLPQTTFAKVAWTSLVPHIG